jgi:hypothetical protein
MNWSDQNHAQLQQYLSSQMQAAQLPFSQYDGLQQAAQNQITQYQQALLPPPAPPGPDWLAINRDCSN